MENIFRGEARIGQVNNIDTLWQFRFQHPAQHGLTASHFANHLDDPFTLHDGVNQGFQNGATISTGKEQTGVRSNFKRRLFQPEIIVIHKHRSPK